VKMMSDVLHRANDSTVFFWCPGCDEPHQVIIVGDKAWGFNGDYKKPTFIPSYLTWADPNPKALPEYPKYRNGFRCHSFITDGNIQYLDDCTHSLKNQTVPLPEWKL